MTFNTIKGMFVAATTTSQHRLQTQKMRQLRTIHSFSAYKWYKIACIEVLIKWKCHNTLWPTQSVSIQILNAAT